jgi:hypothetical protein
MGCVAEPLLCQASGCLEIVQRKVPAPNDFLCLQEVSKRLSSFGHDYASIARPFEWKFARADLNALIARVRLRYAQTRQPKLVA